MSKSWESVLANFLSDEDTLTGYLEVSSEYGFGEFKPSIRPKLKKYLASKLNEDLDFKVNNDYLADAFLLTSDMTGITFAFVSNETKNLKFIAMNWLDILLDSDKFDYDYEKQEIVLNNYLNKNDVQLFQTEDGTLYHPTDDYGDENENIWVINDTNGNEVELNIIGNHHERF